jgi:hypothetical protein
MFAGFALAPIAGLVAGFWILRLHVTDYTVWWSVSLATTVLMVGFCVLALPETLPAAKRSPFAWADAYLLAYYRQCFALVRADPVMRTRSPTTGSVSCWLCTLSLMGLLDVPPPPPPSLPPAPPPCTHLEFFRLLSRGDFLS